MDHCDKEPLAEPREDSERPPKRRKTAIACQNCRARKVRCDGVRPVCRTCVNRLATDTCSYASSLTNGQDDSQRYIETLKQKLRIYEGHPGAGEPQPDTNTNGDQPSPIRTSQPTDWQGIPFDSNEPGETASTVSSFKSTIPRTGGHSSDGRTLTSVDDQSSPRDANSIRRPSHAPSPHGYVRDFVKQGYMGDSSSASFMNNLRRTVRARNALDDEHSHATSGPYLALVELGPKPDSIHVRSHDENLALPPRHVANSLMEMYWRNHYPLYPAVDFLAFQASYEAIWSGNSLGDSESMTHCTLNLMLALGAQSARSTHQQQTTLYFSRAKNLLRRDLLTGWSFQLVQALILYSQYLQSTDDPHQCWTVVGMAIRMAESLGLHVASTSRNLKSPSERELARRVWYCCVTLDRAASMTLGRSPAISVPSANAVDYPSADDPSPAPDPAPARDAGDAGQASVAKPPRIDIFIYSLRLFNILHHILLTFYVPNQTQLLDKNHVPAHLSKLMELEENLQDWLHSLPPHLRINSEMAGMPNFEIPLLKLRYVNVRLLLYRPILSFTMLKSMRRELLPETLPVGTAALLACSRVCIESAIQMADVTHNHILLDSSSSEMPTSPWWYNVCYSYTAATTILAAKANIDLTAQVGEAALDHGMKQCVSVLEQYKATFPSASRCLAALSHIAHDLELESIRNTPIRSLGGEGLAQPVDLNADELIMDYEGGLIDMSWLDSIPFDLVTDQCWYPKQLATINSKGVN